jgi:hypothetical protein
MATKVGGFALVAEVSNEPDPTIFKEITDFSILPRLVAPVGGVVVSGVADSSDVINVAVQTVTTTTLSKNVPGIVAYGTSATWTATVSGSSSPTGFVEFRDGATVLDTVALVGGQAQYTTSFPGAHTLNCSAYYLGDTNNLPSSASGPIGSVQWAGM